MGKLVELEPTLPLPIYLADAILSPEASNARFPSLIDATLEDLSGGLKKGCFKSTDLVKAYLARINQVNDQLHAVTEVNPDALAIAASLDEERAKNRIRGPLHGIPILLKNNIATMDKMNNTAGSQETPGSWRHFTRENYSQSMVVVSRQQHKQWLDPQGSSSGSAVATDLGLAWAAIGTETVGSILAPSHRSGIVGIKPTVGLTSRDLVIPISERQDSVGSMARTVRDAAYILQAIAGSDPRDTYTSAIPNVPNYLDALNGKGLKRARIGVPWNAINLTIEGSEAKLSPELDAFKKALEVLTEAGATVVETDFSMAQEILLAPQHTRYADFPANLAAYLAELTSSPSNVHTLADVREWTRNSPLEEYPDRNTRIWDHILDAKKPRSNTSKGFLKWHQKSLKLAGPGGLLGALDRDDLNAVVMPTISAPFWASTIGAPGITVPMGNYLETAPVYRDAPRKLVDTGPSVPFGLTFLGRQWSEAQLIGLAYDFEQRTRVRGRVRPKVVPSAELNTAVC
ncbi:amidase [Hirsutella rhossiliensis]|uniref:Amidase domain-containing protein n=1 Tax=Hirsutella rhossiliensis TaxID=111463 RepID=A0A9P8MTY9_9HYPO|nr:amidase domain-containing protein [Hirsutella rhossiliensis]KAH0961027.1 amidase domain-containing protein [Hirsutella rhossiliensis]